MLDFSDQPYRYFPPKYNGLVAWLIGLVNRYRRLPKTLKVDRVDVSGHDVLLSQRQPGDRLLFLPNHPTHADAAVFIEALNQLGLSSQMMAAYDVFLRGRIDAWIMQKLGAFSVDREGSDGRAMKQAAEVLTRGKHVLTIFPEGNVYLRNDLVTPFSDGAAFIALRCAKELAKQNVRILAVPVSIKLTHLTDCRPDLTRQLHSLAAALNLPEPDTDPHKLPRDLIVQIGTAAIRRNLTQRGLTAPDTDDLAELIAFSAGTVLDDLETKLELTPKPDTSLIDRVRGARRMIHEVRTNESRVADHAAALTWADAAMLAFRIASYQPDYIAARPTLDRVSETVEKITEDVHTRMPDPFAVRRALVRFNPPLPLDTYLAEGKRSRQAVRELTEACETSVQNGVNELNELNEYSGGMLYEEV